MNVIQEHFDSIHQMLEVLDGRTNNSVMNGKNKSHDGDEDFTKTKSWSEAVELFQTGYTDVLEQIKTGIAKGVKPTGIENRRKVRTGVVGYAPHVPNAILGLPNSMIATESQPQKIKTVSIIQGIVDNCGTGADEFIKCGIATLSAVNMLELSGVRVSLKVAFYCAETGNDFAFGTVKVKDYREHMDIRKLCFPMVHPSMFRRFGFKWLETCSGLSTSGWSWGYGRSCELKINLQGDERYIDMYKIKKLKYDPEQIIDFLKAK